MSKKQDPYVKFLKENIQRTVAQTRTQLDSLRPSFQLSKWREVPNQLKDLTNLFARMDIILREVEKQVSTSKINKDRK